jgi:hypothetical protein
MGKSFSETIAGISRQYSWSYKKGVWDEENVNPYSGLFLYLGKSSSEVLAMRETGVDAETGEKMFSEGWFASGKFAQGFFASGVMS